MIFFLIFLICYSCFYINAPCLVEADLIKRLENIQNSGIDPIEEKNVLHKQKHEFVKYLKNILFQDINLQKEPQNLEKIPQKLISSFNIYSDSHTKFIPKIERARVFKNSSLKNNETLLSFSIPNTVFLSVNHLEAEVYIQNPLKQNIYPSIYSTDKIVNITKIFSKLDENGDWLMLSFKIIYIMESKVQQDINFFIKLNDADFKDLTALNTRGAIVYLRSSQNFNTHEKREICESSCCPMKAEVNFEQIGWSRWIIKPKSIKLSYCMGDCQTPPDYYTFHSNILWRMIQVYKDKAPKPNLCCAPYELYSYSMMFYDTDGMIHQKIIPEVEVKSCICT